MRLSTALLAATLPIYYGGAAIANDFVVIFFGDKWRDAGPVMSFILLAAAPMLLRSLVPAALKAAESTGSLYKFSAVEIVSGLFWSSVTVHFGPIAVAAGTMIDPHGSLFINRDILRKSLGVRLLDLFRSVSPYVLAGLGMFALVKMFEMTIATGWQPWPRVIASIVIGAVVYPALLMAFWRPTLGKLIEEIEPLMPRRIRPLFGRFALAMGAAGAAK
jgi:O-antigen/teichoic acid export membrane protein